MSTSELIREVAGQMVMPAVVIEKDEQGNENPTDRWSVTFYTQGQQQLVLTTEGKEQAYRVAERLQNWLIAGMAEVVGRLEHKQELVVGSVENRPPCW